MTNVVALLITPAETRLDRVRLSGATEWTDYQVQLATYRCPHCKSTAELSTSTLRKAEKLHGSPLGPEWHRQCEGIRPLAGWEWALDHRCSGCRCPVRIVFAADTEFAMGSHTHRLVDVIEMAACLGSGASDELTSNKSLERTREG
jgi:hypothetical protein